MKTYYKFMLNKQNIYPNLIPTNNYVISKYKSSSYITNKMNDLKSSSFLYNIGISLAGGIFYGFLSTLIDESITKKIFKDS